MLLANTHTYVDDRLQIADRAVFEDIRKWLSRPGYVARLGKSRPDLNIKQAAAQMLADMDEKKGNQGWRQHLFCVPANGEFRDGSRSYFCLDYDGIPTITLIIQRTLLYGVPKTQRRRETRFLAIEALCLYAQYGRPRFQAPTPMPG